jgi:serine/threonine-protein kinase RsbW
MIPRHESLVFDAPFRAGKARDPAVSACRTFKRRFDAIPDIFAFTADVFGLEHIDRAILPTVDLTIEELFTNMVKYGASKADVRINMTGVAGGVEVILTDYDVDPFDVTQAPEADVTLPIEQRTPGGLGLHLIRRLVDSIEYEYSVATRQSRITFRKTLTTPPPSVDRSSTGHGGAGD